MVLSHNFLTSGCSSVKWAKKSPYGVMGGFEDSVNFMRLTSKIQNAVSVLPVTSHLYDIVVLFHFKMFNLFCIVMLIRVVYKIFVPMHVYIC